MMPWTEQWQHGARYEQNEFQLEQRMFTGSVKSRSQGFQVGGFSHLFLYADRR